MVDKGERIIVKQQSAIGDDLPVFLSGKSDSYLSSEGGGWGIL